MVVYKSGDGDDKSAILSQNEMISINKWIKTKFDLFPLLNFFMQCICQNMKADSNNRLMQ
jgi:hypothetical protein